MPRALSGAGRAGIIETTFREETETDLFGEQAVLCGGLTSLMKAGYETLVEAGYAPEMAYFECIHEVKLIVDLIYENGVANMRYSVSNTAEYGDFKSGPRVIDDGVRERMRGRSSTTFSPDAFARDFIEENRSGNISFNAMRRQAAEHPMEEVGSRVCAASCPGWPRSHWLIERRTSLGRVGPECPPRSITRPRRARASRSGPPASSVEDAYRFAVPCRSLRERCSARPGFGVGSRL